MFAYLLTIVTIGLVLPQPMRAYHAFLNWGGSGMGPPVRSRHSNSYRASPRQSPWSTLAGLLLLAFLFGFPVAVEFGPPVVGCSIKGNISMNTGERIYHVPGQRYYDVTRIDLFKGERWFCSEDAARAAGWRKSRV